jgi:hypothetical protein
MPTDHILSLLIAERDKLNGAIEVLEGISRRGGRPRKNATPTIDATPTPNDTRKRPRWTPPNAKPQPPEPRRYGLDAGKRRGRRVSGFAM